VYGCAFYGIDRGVENAIVIVLAFLVPGFVLLQRWCVTPGRFPMLLMMMCCAVVVGGSCSMGGGYTSTGWWVVVKAGALLIVLVYVEVARSLFRSRHGVPIAVVVKRGD